jgi:hypothetical protein
MARRFDEVFSGRIRKYLAEKPIRYGKDVQTRYWMELTEELSKTGIISSEVPNPHNWYCIVLEDVPYAECRMELHAYSHRRQIKTSIVIEKSRIDLFEYLLKDKSAIEEEIGFELDWDKNQGRRFLRKTLRMGIRDEGNWAEAISWHIDCALKFKNAIYPRILEFYDGLN